MLMYLLFIYIFVPQIAVGEEEEKRFGVPKQELERLQDLKYYLCGLTEGYVEGRKWRGIGWFCVNKANCSGTEGTYKIAEGTEPDVACGDLRYNEGRDTCCFTGKLNPPVAFENPNKPDWDLYTFVKNKSHTQDLAEMEDYKIALFRENLHFVGGEDMELQLHSAQICSLLPSGEKDGKTLWTPYICVDVTNAMTNCNENLNITEAIRFPFGDRFCSKGNYWIGQKRICCHIAATLDKPLDPSTLHNTDVQLSWKFSAYNFQKYQSYAPGFRARFMCEIYNKLVCEGERDHCAQRVLHRTEKVLPSEFPHHALVGLTLPKRQTFHCQGSIVSRLFVLTSYECREHDNALANIVLVGTFTFELNDGTPIDETISYVKNHISAPTLHWFTLLKLWRPLKLSAFVKPACIDWYSYDKDLSSKTFDFGTGWVVGYGPSSLEGNFTTKITRNNYNFESTKTISKANKEFECWERMSSLRKKYLKFIKSFDELDNHICVLGGSIYSPYLEKQLKIDKNHSYGNNLGYFARGASFSVFERYCQWKVYGIFIQNEKHYNTPPLLFETVPYAAKWLEDVIWREDFNVLFFNLSWPDCADWENYSFNPARKGGKANEADHQFNFYSKDYYYVKPQHNIFFDGVDNI